MAAGSPSFGASMWTIAAGRVGPRKPVGVMREPSGSCRGWPGGSAHAVGVMRESSGSRRGWPGGSTQAEREMREPKGSHCNRHGRM